MEFLWILSKYFDDDDDDDDSLLSSYHMPGIVVRILRVLTWYEDTQKAKEKHDENDIIPKIRKNEPQLNIIQLI